MPLDLIAFDLDGTTLNSLKELSAANSNALQKAYKLGVKLVPCTGRSLCELPEELHRFIDQFGFAIFPYIITDNGAQLYDLPKKELLYTRNISEKTALAILAEGRKRLAATYGSFGIQGATDTQGRIWETEEGKRYMDGFTRKWQLPVANLEALIKWHCGVVKMSMNFRHAQDCKKAIEEFSTWPDLALSSADDENIEFMQAGISKGKALSFVAKHSGIPMERTMAIGDNFNDMEMIILAGFGVAMGNAVPELKEKADWVTAVNDENGLALAIEKMLAMP
jgi:Cof subfamily protein (haloacid dehalogenase superfamily)